MSVLLSKAKGSLTIKLLIDTLTETMEFESSMATKFGLPVEYKQYNPRVEVDPFCQLSEILTATSTSVRTVKSISSAFEPHMGVYIDAQDR
jgi:hypothetical protein